MISHQTSLYDVNVTRGIVVAYIELQLHTTTDEKTRDGVHIQREIKNMRKDLLDREKEEQEVSGGGVVRNKKKVEKRKETGKGLARFCSVGSIALSRIALFSMYICSMYT